MNQVQYVVSVAKTIVELNKQHNAIILKGETSIIILGDNQEDLVVSDGAFEAAVSYVSETLGYGTVKREGEEITLYFTDVELSSHMVDEEWAFELENTIKWAGDSVVYK